MLLEDELDAEAYNYYQSTLRNTPEYELEFYTKLNMAQVTVLSKNGDIKKIRKYFKKLLKDPKNLEYKDKIYYEMAYFELKQGNLDGAIGYFKKHNIITGTKTFAYTLYSNISANRG